MSHLFKFASLAHPEKYGYAFDSSAWDRSGSGETHAYYRQFETYGDGLTQHSNDWSVTFEYLTDYLASMAAAMLNDNELISAASYSLQKAPRLDEIEFAAGIVFRDSDRDYQKRRYFSMDLRKMGTRAKEYDKRFKEIGDWHDGTRGSIYRLCMSEYASKFDCFQVAEAVNTWADAQKKHVPVGVNFPEFFPKYDPKLYRLREALQACRYLAESYNQRRCAEATVENYRAAIVREAARSAAQDDAAQAIAS